jgi:hypothetical protein
MKDTHRSSVRQRAGSVSLSSLTLFLVAVGCIVLVARRATSFTDDSDTDNLSDVSSTGSAVVAGSDTAPQQAPTAAQAIGTLKVRDAHGALVPLVTKGQPAIVMVSSVTCAWCKRSLKDLGELAGGRPLPRLKLLTLEGAADGAPMLAKEHLTGAQLIGPAGSSDQVLLTFRFNGTPTFVAIDRNGRVVATMPGYPIREEMKRWFAVMVGDSEVP